MPTHHTPAPRTTHTAEEPLPSARRRRTGYAKRLAAAFAALLLLGAINVASPHDNSPAVAATGWAAVGNYTGGDVFALAFDSAGNLYAGDEDGYVWKYDGTAWSDLGDLGGSAVRALTVTNDDRLFAGGLFTDKVKEYSGSGQAWTSVGQTPLNANVYALTINSGGDLVAGGSITNLVQSIDISDVAGNNWSNVGSFTGHSPVESLFVSDSGDLYAGAKGPGSSGNGGAWKFSGGTWSQLVDASSSVLEYATIYDFGLAADGELIALSHNSTYRKIVSFAPSSPSSTTGTWSTVGDGLDGNAYALAGSADGALYAGGVQTGRVSVLNDGTWEVLGGGTTSGTVYALAISSTGSVYAGGSFSTMGGVSTGPIAVYTPTNPSPSASTTNAPTYTFSFTTSGGGPCLPNVTVVRGQSYTLPDSSVACTPEGTSLVGWSIKGQDWAFRPGREVEVSDSQTFRAVARNPVIDVTYDSNVGMDTPCLSPGQDMDTVADRSTISAVPRTEASTLAAEAACTPEGFELIGWTDANTPEGSGQAQPGANTYAPGAPLPETWNLPGPNPINEIRLYALWKQAHQS